MDFAPTTIALAVIIFAVQVPLDTKYTSFQRVFSVGVVLCMVLLVLIVQFDRV